MTTSLDLSTLLTTPGTESPSGPRTTIYRRWDESDWMKADLLHTPYSEDLLRSPRVILTGLYLSGHDRACLGILACTDSDDTPWERGPMKPTRASKIFLERRIQAMTCRTLSYGDLTQLAIYRLAEEIRALCSTKKTRPKDILRARVEFWISHLEITSAVVDDAIDTATALLRASPPQDPKAALEAMSSLRDHFSP